MIIKNTVKKHAEGLCEGLNTSKTKGLNKHTPGRVCACVCISHFEVRGRG